MANTVIALKKSATPSASPNDLANGEIAINYADGVLYYKNAAGYIAQITSGAGGGNAFGTVNANGTLVVADTTGDVFSLIPGNNISIIGDAVNDKITVALKDDVTIPGILTMGAVGGDEGGEIQLANALTNQSLAGKVTIDVYQNKIRFFENGGTSRGAYIDLTATSGGAGTDLLSPGSTTDSFARTTASAAYDKANSANSLAYNTGIGANAFTSATISGANTAVGTGANAYAAAIANTIAIAAFDYANTISSDADEKANAAIITANSAYDKANSANVLAYNTGIGANAFTSTTIAGANTAVGTGANAYAAAIANTIAIAAFEYANTISSDADEKANAAIITANAAYDKANSANINASFANTVAIAAYNYANGITFTQDNTISNLAYDKANSANVLAYQIGGALDKVNTTVTYANSAWDKANAANYYAYLVDTNAKAAYDFANTITFTQDNTIANLAYDKANSANVLAYNTGIGANGYADATFVKLSATEQTIDSDITITGNLIVSGNTVAYSANNLIVNDPLIILANNNISDALDIGFVGHYQNTNGYNVHTGFYREHENKMYYLFNDYDKEPGTINHIGAFSNNMTLAVLNADLITSNLTLAGVNAVITLRSSYDKANAANLLALAAFNKANANNGIGNSSDKQVLFNDGGISNGSVGLTYNKTTSILTANVITIGSSQINSIVIVTSTTDDQSIDTFANTDWRSAHYHVTMNAGSNYQTTQISLLHDGFNAYMTEYGYIANNGILGVFSAVMDSSTVRFNIAPTNAVTTIRLLRTTVQ